MENPENLKCEVIANVSEMSHREWLDLRSTGIGGSDTAAIYGESSYTSPYTLWAQKSGREKREVVTNEAMEWGNLLEGVVANKFAKEYNYSVVEWPVMLKSKKNAFMLANLDFLIVEASKEFPAGKVTRHDSLEPPTGINAILEIKTTGIVGRGSAHLWEDNHIPRAYELQGLHYATVTGIEQVVFAALVANEGLVVRGRLYDESEMLQCEITEAIFWSSVKSGIPPELDGSESTSESIRKMYPKSKEGTVVEADEYILETYYQYIDEKRILDMQEEKVKELRSTLEMAIGEGEVLEYNGKPLLTYKSNKDSMAFDVKSFEVAYPEMYEQFLMPRKGARVMRVKKV